MGNFTRMSAVLRELQSLYPVDVSVVAQGHSYGLAASRYTTFRLEDAVYGKGPFSGWGIVLRNLSFPCVLRRNRLRCAEILDEVKPCLVIADSDFFCLSPAKERGIPIVSINSSAATLKLYREFGLSSSNAFFSYHFIEKIDRHLQRKYAGAVVCPVLRDVALNEPRTHVVHPIVRESFLRPPHREPSPPAVDLAVLLGGSGIGQGSIDLSGFRGSTVVLGRGNGLKAPPGAEVIQFEEDPSDRLRRARVLMVQGGFNSVSEVVALRKPAVIIPIRRHAEQMVNARCAESMGFAKVGFGPDAASLAEEILNDIDRYEKVCASSGIPCTGAAEAARLIAVYM